MNQKFDIIELKWDTEFFGVKSAKVVLKGKINQDDIEDIKLAVKNEKYQFITINNQNNDDENNFYLKKIKNIFLADVNVQLIKKVTGKNVIQNDDIEIQNNFEYEPKILEICEQSFLYSRFYNDKNLKNSEKIYVEWAKNSFNKENKYFCVYKQEKEILGYILFSIELDALIIELIAVNNKQQSKGIGSQLLGKLEEYASINHIKEIHVGTQLNNIKAQNFYIKSGFRHSTNNSIYHWWIEEE